ncbi:MAG: hypothetical protein O3C05_01425 [Proteobacteria bacterium]|nr:hypothetical protein [Pseudomonadota bacterium]
MSIHRIIRKLPNYAPKIGEVLFDLFYADKSNQFITDKDVYGVALTVGYFLRHEEILNAVREDARIHLEDNDAAACKTAAIYISMHSIEYFHNHITEHDNKVEHIDDSIMTQIFSDNIHHNEQEMDLRLCYIASAFSSGNEYLIRHYIKKAKESNIAPDTLKEIIKISATLKAAAHALDIEKMRRYDFIVRGASMEYDD